MLGKFQMLMECINQTKDKYKNASPSSSKSGLPAPPYCVGLTSLVKRRGLKARDI